MKHIIIACKDPTDLLKIISFVTKCSNELWEKDYEEFCNDPEEQKSKMKNKTQYICTV